MGWFFCRLNGAFPLNRAMVQRWGGIPNIGVNNAGFMTVFSMATITQVIVVQNFRRGVS